MSNLWDYRPVVWDYRESTWTMDGDLIGYGVVATDGAVGTIDHATTGRPAPTSWSTSAPACREAGG